MAPEVISGEGHDARADVWSLGITLVELSEGAVPHGALSNPLSAMFRIVNGPPPVLVAADSAPMAAFVELCLTKQPQRRPSVGWLLRSQQAQLSVIVCCCPLPSLTVRWVVTPLLCSDMRPS